MTSLDDDVPPPWDDDPPATSTTDDGLDFLRANLTNGGSFILDAPDTIPAVWGEGNRVAWAEGESLIIAGGPGVGKTTIAGQVTRGLLLGGTVLGLPIKQRRRVLYLAMDRPKQAARALRRTLGDIPRETLDQRLVVWPGPPIADVARHPETLLALVQEADADVVVVDSVKDAAVGLSEDAVGAGYNRARQHVLRAGVDVLELHHTVKKGTNGAAPTTLADIYGSTWITSGAGSVVLLVGEAGDPVVELRHVKQPAEDIGPMKVLHDHDTGTSTVFEATDLVTLAGQAGGITAKAAAAAMFTTETPTAAEVQKARRRLRSLAGEGRLTEIPGDDATQTAARWVAAATLTPTLTRTSNRKALTEPSRPLRPDTNPQVNTHTGTLTGLTEGGPYVFPPPIGGET